MNRIPTTAAKLLELKDQAAAAHETETEQFLIGVAVKRGWMTWHGWKSMGALKKSPAAMSLKEIDVLIALESLRIRTNKIKSSFALPLLAGVRFASMDRRNYQTTNNNERKHYEQNIKRDHQLVSSLYL